MDMAEGSMLSTALMSLLLENQGQFSCIEGAVAENCCSAQKKRELGTKGVLGEIRIIVFVHQYMTDTTKA